MWLSLPAGERGLKWRYCRDSHLNRHVAPRRGAWIEILPEGYTAEKWEKSLPAGERGLKYFR